MHLARTVLFLFCIAVPTWASAQARPDLRSALKGCLSYAVLKNNLETSPVDGFYEVTVSCSEEPARTLYVAVGRAGIAEAMTQFVEGQRGLLRRFGKSACYQVTEGASGEPRQEFHCRIALDVGDALLRGF